MLINSYCNTFKKFDLNLNRSVLTFENIDKEKYCEIRFFNISLKKEGIKKEGWALEFIMTYIDKFGYIVLFTTLMLELLGLPLPGEVVMGYTGVLIFQGHLNWIISILMAWAGSSLGMSGAYWIGYKLGTPFFEKYGHRFHLGITRIEKTSKWFSKYGNKLLVIAYFIPVIRHITGYFAGITRLTFRTYMLYAYSGAFLWVTIFISLGKILGPQWEQFHHSIKKYFIIAKIIAIIIVIVIYMYKKHKISL